MFSTSYFIYGKGEGKGGCLEGKDFLFMIVSILPISLFRRNNLKSCSKYFFSESGD